MSISRTADAFYTYRFIRILTTKWEDMDAYELGIIDENGTVLKKSRELKTTEEKDAYTIFHRLVFNIKRLLEKLPFGKSQLASYSAALFLIKEETGLPDDKIEEIMRSIFQEYDYEPMTDLDESHQEIAPGVYSLAESCILPSTGEPVIPTGTKVMIPGNTDPVASYFGIDLYEAAVVNTGQKIYVTRENIK